MTTETIPRLNGEPVGLARRLAAMVYDSLAVTALLFIAGFSVLPFTGGVAVPAGSVWFELYLLALVFMYFGWSWTHGGQTLGMRAWRLYATDLDGHWLTWAQAGLRFAAAIPSVLVALLGVLWTIVDPQRRALHERLSRSRTLHVPKSAS